jgi:hypothetical protein
MCISSGFTGVVVQPLVVSISEGATSPMSWGRTERLGRGPGYMLPAVQKRRVLLRPCNMIARHELKTLHFVVSVPLIGITICPFLCLMSCCRSDPGFLVRTTCSQALISMTIHFFSAQNSYHSDRFEQFP